MRRMHSNELLCTLLSYAAPYLATLHTSATLHNAELYAVASYWATSKINDIETKAQLFRYRSLGSERIQKVLMCYNKILKRKRNLSISSKNFETKPKRFDVFQNF